MRLLAGIVVLALVTAGCAGSPGAEPTEDDTYWLVQVRGNETHEPAPGYACGAPYDHRINRSEKRLTYIENYDLSNASFVIAFDVWDQSTQCPAEFSLHAGYKPVTVEVGRYGNLTLDPRENGNVIVTANASQLELAAGEDLEETYEDTYEDDEGRQVNVSGQFVIEHLGEWPTDRLQAEN